MNHYDYEQGLREEVIYLHSLWHQGPPTTQNPTHNTNPSRNLHLTANRKPYKTRSNKNKTYPKTLMQPDPQPLSGKEWPVNPTLSPQTTGWPQLKPCTDPPTRPISIEHQAQYKAIQTCREFFSKGMDMDDEEESEDDDVLEEGNDDYLIGFSDDTNYQRSEVFKLLSKLFVEDSILRGFYERSYDSGEFCCLVCRGVGEKLDKKFKGCVGLVLHCNSIMKTKGKRAHRAFSYVICKVLGWDITRLPMIVSKGEPLSRLLASPVATQGEHERNVDGNRFVSNSDSMNAIISESGRVAKDGEFNAHEGPYSPLKEDGNKHVENLDNTVSSIQADDEEVTGYQGSEPSLGIQWPCGWATLNSQTASVADTSSSVALGWSSSKPRETSVARPLTAEEQIRCAALQLQKKVVEACQEFFVNAAGSESDADDDGDDGEDSLMDEDTFEECDEFNFFLRVFTENGELRNYYENNHEGGEFYCLVCGGIGKKAWKTFKGSAGLLQHSTTVLKTKKRRAHRAFGQVLCKVFGWGIDKHPINVSRGETLGSSLVRLSEVQQKPLRKLV